MSSFLDSSFKMMCLYMFQAGSPVSMLTVQYRMHPLICAWPSAFFYDRQLADAPGLTAARGAPFHALPCFPPLAFFDCRYGLQKKRREEKYFLTCSAVGLLWQKQLNRTSVAWPLSLNLILNFHSKELISVQLQALFCC